MKKYYVGMPIVIIWSIIFLISIMGFVWEMIDVSRFVFFAFITSILIPLIIEIILIIIFCQYITIDENGIKKYIFRKIIVEYKWSDIKEIKVDQGCVYISLYRLNGNKKAWNKKKYIYVMYSDKVIAKLKECIKEEIIINF